MLLKKNNLTFIITYFQVSKIIKKDNIIYATRVLYIIYKMYNIVQLLIDTQKKLEHLKISFEFR